MTPKKEQSSDDQGGSGEAQGSSGVTFPPGHFHEENARVLERITNHTTVKGGVKEYVTAAVDAGLRLLDAGASPEQIRASLNALKDPANFEQAWKAIAANAGIQA